MLRFIFMVSAECILLVFQVFLLVHVRNILYSVRVVMPAIKISGVDVKFPFKPYSSQIAMMCKVKLKITIVQLNNFVKLVGKFSCVSSDNQRLE